MKLNRKTKDYRKEMGIILVGERGHWMVFDKEKEELLVTVKNKYTAERLLTHERRYKRKEIFGIKKRKM